MTAAEVLVLRALGLGDALTAVPALRGLRRLFPGRLLVLATAHPVARLLHAYGLVDRVLPVRDLGDWPPGLALRRHVAVNLHGSGPHSHRLLDAGRPDTMLAFRCAPAHHDGPDWDPREHEVSRWCRLVRSAGGECDADDLRLGPPPGITAAPRLAVVHPGAAAGSRRWPANRWAAVARALRRGGRDVVLTGSAGERRLCARVRHGAGLPVTANLAGRLGVDELADLVAGAGLLLSGDTGVAHLATAYGTPSVVLFGPVAPALWGPAVDHHVHRALWHGPHGGDPHGDRPDAALLRITVGEVLAAVRDVAPASLHPEAGNRKMDERDRNGHIWSTSQELPQNRARLTPVPGWTGTRPPEHHGYRSVLERLSSRPGPVQRGDATRGRDDHALRFRIRG